MANGIMKGVRNSGASSSLSARPKYGIVNYEYTPWQKPTWDGVVPAGSAYNYTPPEVVEEEVVETGGSGNGSNGIVNDTINVDVSNNPTLTNPDGWTSPSVITGAQEDAILHTPGQEGIADDVGEHTNIADLATSVGFEDVEMVDDNYTGIPNVDESFGTTFTGNDIISGADGNPVEGTYEQPVVVVDSSNAGDLTTPTSINLGSETSYDHVSGDGSLSSTNQLAQGESKSDGTKWVQDDEDNYNLVTSNTGIFGNEDPESRGFWERITGKEFGDTNLGSILQGDATKDQLKDAAAWVATQGIPFGGLAKKVYDKISGKIKDKEDVATAAVDGTPVISTGGMNLSGIVKPGEVASPDAFAPYLPQATTADQDETQRLQVNEQIRSFAETLPEGSRRRIDLMNSISHQKGVVPGQGLYNQIKNDIAREAREADTAIDLGVAAEDALRIEQELSDAQPTEALIGSGAQHGRDEVSITDAGIEPRVVGPAAGSSTWDIISDTISNAPVSDPRGDDIIGLTGKTRDETEQDNLATQAGVSRDTWDNMSAYDKHEAAFGSNSGDERDQAAYVAKQEKLKYSNAIPNLSGQAAKDWLNANGYGNYDRKEAADAIRSLRQDQQRAQYNNRGGIINMMPTQRMNAGGIMNRQSRKPYGGIMKRYNR